MCGAAPIFVGCELCLLQKASMSMKNHKYSLTGSCQRLSLSINCVYYGLKFCYIYLGWFVTRSKISALGDDMIDLPHNINELIITRAVQEDLPVILDIQRITFLEVAKIFNLKSMSQTGQTLESLIDEFNNGIF